ncbi:hypothetical protein [Chitinophaga sp.]|uniref:hypothetical protein n=1 Tax=Chitinophaga sp. TaxID=1869181 RepID=UPI002F951281
MKYHQTKIIGVVLFLSYVAVTCKKSSTEPPKDQGKLEVISNASLANKSNALQGIYTSADNNYRIYYYGNFNSKGVPERIEQMMLRKTAGDTAVSVVLDQLQRPKYCFVSIAGVKMNGLVSFHYDEANKTAIKVFDYNFSNNDSKLLYSFVVDNPSGKLESKVSYASLNGGLLMLLLQAGATSPDPWMSQVITAQGAVKLIDMVVLGVSALGCTISLPACIAGGIAAAMVGTNAANASEMDLDRAPADAPPSPKTQTENSQAETTSYMLGTNKLFQFSYGGGIYCVLNGEYFDAFADIKLKKSTGSIISSKIFIYQKETKIDPSCSPTPVIPVNQHVYTYTSGGITGNNVNIKYAWTTGRPFCYVTLTGTLKDNVITGAITMDRNDGALGSLDYNISIPITIKQLY